MAPSRRSVLYVVLNKHNYEPAEQPHNSPMVFQRHCCSFYFGRNTFVSSLSPLAALSSSRVHDGVIRILEGQFSTLLKLVRSSVVHFSRRWRRRLHLIVNHAGRTDGWTEWQFFIGAPIISAEVPAAKCAILCDAGRSGCGKPIKPFGDVH